MKKVSQQIASVFLIIDAMFLIPMVLIGILFIIPIFLYGGLIALGSILSGKHILYGVSFFSIFLIMFGSFIFGCHLMKGYYKHVLGKLADKKANRLWVKTIIFNVLLFVPSLYFQLKCRLTGVCMIDSLRNFSTEIQLYSEFSPITILTIIWWMTAITLSSIAFFLTRDTKESDTIK